MRKDLTWAVRQAQQRGLSFVVTVHGNAAAALVPMEMLQASDAKSGKRAKKIASLVTQLVALLPGAASSKRRRAPAAPRK